MAKEYNCSAIKKQVKKIKVKNVKNEDVAVTNSSNLEMIGKGRQGAVFKLSNKLCMKVYGNPKDCKNEFYALSLGKKTSLFPKVYCKGKNFIVMEMIHGVAVREYLERNRLSRELSAQLIKMLLTFRKIGFDRIDHHTRQIYLQEDGSLKVIDVVRAVRRKRMYLFPRKLLKSLGEKNSRIFLRHVREMAPELYDEWKRI